MVSDEFIKDLRSASQWLSRPFDSEPVLKLVDEVGRLRASSAEHERECEATRNEFQDRLAEPQRANEKLQTQLRKARERLLANANAISSHAARVEVLRQLLEICSDDSAEPEAATIVRTKLTEEELERLDIFMPPPRSATEKKRWVQVTEKQFAKLERAIPNAIHYAVDGLYLHKIGSGEQFAYRLFEGGCFVRPGFLKVYSLAVAPDPELSGKRHGPEDSQHDRGAFI